MNYESLFSGKKNREIPKVHILLFVSSSWLSQTSSLFESFHAFFMQCLA